MGSWNKTCGLSNLHIHYGTPVYVFVLEENIKRRNYCDTTPFFKPLLLPFKSTYNDYGDGKNSHGVALPYILQALKEKLIEQPTGENPCHDIPVIRAKFNEKLFWDAVCERRLFTNNYKGEPQEVNFAMMRKDIVDYVLKNWRFPQYTASGSETTGFPDVLRDKQEVLDIVEKATKTDDHTHFGIFDIAFAKGRDNAIHRLMRGVDYRYSNLVEIRHLIYDLIKHNNRTEAESILDGHIKALFIDSFMESTRKVWTPGALEGSQNSDHLGYHILNDAINNALAEECEE